MLPKSLEHVKRIRKVQRNQRTELLLVVGHVSEVSLQDIEAFKAQNNILSPTETAKVPKHKAHTMEQLHQWKSVWPITYHVSRKMEDYQLKDVDIMQQQLQKLMEMHQTSSDRNCCLVLDQQQRQVAMAVDQRHEHPLHHAAFLAIQQVAQRESQRRTGLQKRDREENDLGYLLTGYDVLMMHEPCVMYLSLSYLSL